MTTQYGAIQELPLSPVGEGLRALTQTNADSVGVDAHIDPSNTAEPTITDESVSLITVDPQIAQIANLNPILYRSYYYDKETEWYYLNSRYYSPDMCRFINADGIVGANQDILAYNMLAYCSNDPINHSDSTGQGKLRNWLKNRWNDFKSSSSAKLNILAKSIKQSVSVAITGISKIYEKTPKPRNIGEGIFKKLKSNKLNKLSNAKSILKGDAVSLAVDVGTSVIGDIIDNEPIGKIIHNALVECAFNAAEIAVGMAATNFATACILTFGTGAMLAINPAIIGGAIAISFAIFVDYLPVVNGMSLKDWLKETD